MAFGDRLGERAPKIFLRVDIQPDVIRPAMGHDSGEDKGGNGRDGADGSPGAVRGDILFFISSRVWSASPMIRRAPSRRVLPASVSTALRPSR